jgi:hypothetical protein
MVPVEIIALYVAVGAAILGGLLLLWCLIEELLQFDPSAHRSRSARVSDADRLAHLVVPDAPPSPREVGRVCHPYPVGGAAH